MAGGRVFWDIQVSTFYLSVFLIVVELKNSQMSNRQNIWPLNAHANKEGSWSYFVLWGRFVEINAGQVWMVVFNFQLCICTSFWEFAFFRGKPNFMSEFLLS